MNRNLKSTACVTIVGRMNIRPYLVRLILEADQLLASWSLPLIHEDGVLLIFLFHSLFANCEELQSRVIYPGEGITVEMLRRFIGHFQEQSYRFVTPAEVLAGLSPLGKYALLTFDDGYYNSVQALPVLEAAGAPAVLYVSSGHVKQGKAFWWDVLYRENQRRGGNHKELSEELLRFKRRRTADVEAELLREVGSAALRPCSDLDRPFTPRELRDVASHPLISLGNHTRDHAILTNYSVQEIREQLQEAQDDIREMTGVTPQSVAYPNGCESSEIARVASEVGLRFGIGVIAGRNRLPGLMESEKIMSLKRFTLLSDRPVDPQCRVSRAGLCLYQHVKSAKARAKAWLSAVAPHEAGGQSNLDADHCTSERHFPR
jgi:peptidoglycan/xylan/chitin deacetylase (PgdA/CDA1 family)